jgi:hypothetical protein
MPGAEIELPRIDALLEVGQEVRNGIGVRLVSG